jgi:hypothetical protein
MISEILRVAEPNEKITNTFPKENFWVRKSKKISMQAIIAKKVKYLP